MRSMPGNCASGSMQAGGIVRDDPPQAGGKRLKQVAQLEVRNHAVVDLEHQLQPVALARQFVLQSQAFFVVQRIVEGNGHLRRHQLGKLNFRLIVSASLSATET